MLQINYWVSDQKGQSGKENPGLGVCDLDKPINLPNSASPGIGND